MPFISDTVYRLVSLFYLGGWLMVPLFLCSVLVLGVCIERWRSFNRAWVDVERLVARAARLVAEDRVPEALDICRDTPGPAAKVLEAGMLARDRPPPEVRTAMADIGKAEVNRLEKYLPILSAVAQVAPLLGLLGTVTGMIEVFQGIEAMGGRVAVGDISGGIWQALLTTAFGIGIGILALLASHYFNRWVEHFIRSIEFGATELLNVLRAREGGSSSLDETLAYSRRRE
jgi:biopolymer transport protein ExbB